MLKRIFAIVSTPDFYSFQQRAKSEGLNMGEALAALAYLYANDEVGPVRYLKEHLAKIRVADEPIGAKPKLDEVQGE
jgi:hypothetical protein